MLPNPMFLKNNEEQHEFFAFSAHFAGKGASRERCQYDYRDTAGELFSCIAHTLEEARTRRDEWIEERQPGFIDFAPLQEQFMDTASTVLIFKGLMVEMTEEPLSLFFTKTVIADADDDDNDNDDNRPVASGSNSPFALNEHDADDDDNDTPDVIHGYVITNSAGAVLKKGSGFRDLNDAKREAVIELQHAIHNPGAVLSPSRQNALQRLSGNKISHKVVKKLKSGK